MPYPSLAKIAIILMVSILLVAIKLQMCGWLERISYLCQFNTDWAMVGAHLLGVDLGVFNVFGNFDTG